MVRRWSYLNHINYVSSIDVQSRGGMNGGTPQAFLKVFHQTAFIATTYHRRTIYDPLTTKLTRKSFFRRKHLHNWIVYQNILSSWSREYLFFRRYARSILALYFYQKSYLFYNQLLLRRCNVREMIGLEGAFVTNLVRSVSSYCNHGRITLLPFTYKVDSSRWFYTSLAVKWRFVAHDSNIRTPLGPVYAITDRSLSTTTPPKTPSTAVLDFFAALEFSNINYLVELYKLILLLVLRKSMLRLY